MLEVAVERCFVKKVFLEISQNSQESTYSRVFFNNVAGLSFDTPLKTSESLWFSDVFRGYRTRGRKIY